MRSMVQFAGQRGLLYLSPGWDTTPEEITAAVKPKKKKKKYTTGQDRIWSPSWSLIRFIASNSSSVALQWWASSPDCLAATNPQQRQPDDEEDLARSLFHPQIPDTTEIKG